MPGSARITSIRRMITSSTQPPTYPDTAPNTTPKARQMTVATRPTISETRAPMISRDSRSRPSSSAPGTNVVFHCPSTHSPRGAA